MSASPERGFVAGNVRCLPATDKPARCLPASARRAYMAFASVQDNPDLVASG